MHGVAEVMISAAGGTISPGGDNAGGSELGGVQSEPPVSGSPFCYIFYIKILVATIFLETSHNIWNKKSSPED